MENVTLLGPKDWDRLMAALEGTDGWEPNEALLEAVREYNEAIKEGRLVIR